MPAKTRTAPREPSPKAARTTAKQRMSLEEVMRELEKSGSEQTRKTYTRHGAKGPMFGVLFGTLHGLMKKIGVDHDLALQLWETGNVDARNLAYKIVDPARLTQAQLERFARETTMWMCGMYVAMLASEGSRGRAVAEKWLGSKEERMRNLGWDVVAQLASRDESIPDSWFADRLTEIQRTIHEQPNRMRYAMNSALIAIGGRSAAFRKAALAAAKKIGKVEVDHGDTACKTPDAATYLEKYWAHAKSKGFESPAAQERARELPRLRC